jgi:AraC-like DNA-binding protein
MVVTPDVLRRLLRARDLLREETSLPVEAIARTVAISPSHFTKQFDALFGATPHQFRIESRLDRARRLLARGDYSVTDVCFEVGFSSLGSFSDLFARRVGVPPSAYRRRAIVQVPGRPPLVPGCLGLLAALPAGAFRR